MFAHGPGLSDDTLRTIIPNVKPSAVLFVFVSEYLQ